MKTRLTLKPGQNGTKKMLDKYGERPLAVRYRYDAARHLRIKTVELVEEELPWLEPTPTGMQAQTPFFVRIGFNEEELRNVVKAAGGIWASERKLWRLPHAVAHAMGLARRIVE